MENDSKHSLLTNNIKPIKQFKNDHDLDLFGEILKCDQSHFSDFECFYF